MKQINGNLIELAQSGKFDVIVHGCNCFCAMESGIARQIKDVFPKAYEADLETRSGDRDKMGKYSWALINRPDTPLVVINGYTQFHYSGNGILADYHAIEELFGRLRSDFVGKRFGYPKIGAGRAKGDWEKISRIIDRSLTGEDHTLVEFTGK